jgi:hypothetical protein
VHIAKHPFNSVSQPLPEPSKSWKEYKRGNDFFVQLLSSISVKLVYLVTKILDLLQMKVQLEEKTKGKDD